MSTARDKREGLTSRSRRKSRYANDTATQNAISTPRCLTVSMSMDNVPLGAVLSKGVVSVNTINGDALGRDVFGGGEVDGSGERFIGSASAADTPSPPLFPSPCKLVDGVIAEEVEDVVDVLGSGAGEG